MINNQRRCVFKGCDACHAPLDSPRMYLIMFLIGLSCVFGASSALATEPLIISVSRTPLSLPFFVAEKLGYFTAEGLSLQINEVIGGHRAMNQLLDGEADLATSSETVVMFNSFKRRDYTVLATFVTSSDDVKIVTQTESGISLPRHLKEKTVGTVTSAASHYFLDSSLLLNGIDPKSVHIKHLQPEEMKDALQKGEVDAISIWEPYPFMIVQTLQGAKLLPKSNVYRLTFNLIATKKILGSRDGDLIKLLGGLERAQRFINTQPEKAKVILSDKLELDQAFIDWIWPSYSYQLTLDQTLITTLESEARWAQQNELVADRRAPNYLDFIYSAPLKEVRPTAVTIVE